MTPKTEPVLLGDILATLAKERQNVDGWDLLYRRFWPFVLTITVRCVRDETLAQDVAQDVFLRLARYCDFDEFRERDEWTFRAYVARVAINTSHDELQRRNRRREESLSIADEMPATDDPAAEAEIRLTITWLSGHLSDADAALVRKLADGATTAEIAAQSDAAPGTVAVRVHRLRKRILNLLSRIR